jgi:hypothetical protein
VTTAAALVAEVDRQAGIAARAILARKSEAEVADTLAEALAMLLTALTDAGVVVVNGSAQFRGLTSQDTAAALAAARIALDAHHELREGAL